MGAKNNQTGLTKNFRPEVRTKPETACSLKRHYRGALREFVGYCDLLAEKDPERFIWAPLSDIAEHCKNYPTGKLYGPRIVKYCKATLRQQGLISEQTTRIRNGVVRTGFIMHAHNSVTEMKKNRCVFASQVAPPVAPLVALVVAPLVAPLSEESCTDRCTVGCTSNDGQVPIKSEEYGHDRKVLPEFAQSLVAPSLVTVKPISLDEPWKPEKIQENSTPAFTAFQPPHVTSQTIGQRFEGANTLEEIVSLMSDGEFTFSLERYENRLELAQNCQKAIRFMQDVPVVDRRTCADLMDRAMMILRDEHHLKHKGWFKVLKVLREDGGRIRVMPKEREREPIIDPTKILKHPFSSLRAGYLDRCAPFEPLLAVR